MLRQVGWLLFWSVGAVAALVVLLFLWAAVPVWLTSAKGGWSHLWFSGHANLVLVAAVAYLAIAIAVILKRHTRGANGAGT